MERCVSLARLQSADFGDIGVGHTTTYVTPERDWGEVIDRQSQCVYSVGEGSISGCRHCTRNDDGIIVFQDGSIKLAPSLSYFVLWDLPKFDFHLS